MTEGDDRRHYFIGEKTLGKMRDPGANEIREIRKYSILWISSG
jgi:hypothetical protein